MAHNALISSTRGFEIQCALRPAVGGINLSRLHDQTSVVALKFCIGMSNRIFIGHGLI